MPTDNWVFERLVDRTRCSVRYVQIWIIRDDTYMYIVFCMCIESAKYEFRVWPVGSAEGRRGGLMGNYFISVTSAVPASRYVFPCRYYLLYLRRCRATRCGDGIWRFRGRTVNVRVEESNDDVRLSSCTGPCLDEIQGHEQTRNIIILWRVLRAASRTNRTA